MNSNFLIKRNLRLGSEIELTFLPYPEVPSDGGGDPRSTTIWT